MSKYQQIEAKEWGLKFEEEKNQFVLIDVRTDEEFQEGHIPGAIHIPVDQLTARLDELNPMKEEKLLFICRSGKRSEKAAQILAEHGFKHLYNLKGGMLQWTGPVEK